MKVQYNFYATLLDGFQSYLSSSEIYQQYYGNSENPKISEEDFEKEQFQSLIDRINRVPFESEASDKGTAFNEVIDCIIENRKSEKWDIVSDKNNNTIVAGRVKNIEEKQVAQTFGFDLKLSVEIAKYLEGALTQQFVESVLPTQYGNVRLYGYIDQLMPFKVVDLKTTKSYKAFKYRNNWQHKVYPFCLLQNDMDITEFE
ncbi:MAG: HNH endonuclease, partial [Bacteroidetes bacterium]